MASTHAPGPDDLDFGATLRGFAPGQTVLKRYTLTRLLGRGGMGVVWLANDNELERHVALKFLPEVVAMDAEAVSDLKRETRRCLDLTHPNIVRIHDLATEGHTTAIAMEYVEGETLVALKLKAPNRFLQVSQLTPLVEQLCHALDYAHLKAKVVHRDLKPANLMVTPAGDLKVLDFGIAASISESASRVSNRGTSGTLTYMSPQQLMGQIATPPDDWYAVGATLFELLTSKPPFYQGAVETQVLNAEPPTLSARRAALGLTGDVIPLAWEKTVAALLAKEPGDRPQSGAAVLAMLEGKSVAPALVAVPSSEESTNKTDQFPLSSKTSSQKALWFGLAAAAAVLVLGVGYYYGVVAPKKVEPVGSKKTQIENVITASVTTAVPEPVPSKAEQKRAELEPASKLEEKAPNRSEKEILAKIEAITVDDSKSRIDLMDSEVKLYLSSATATARREVSAAWLAKSGQWQKYFSAHEPGELFLNTEPEGATLIMDGVEKKSPARFINLKPGHANFRIEAKGYDSANESFEVVAGKLTEPAVFHLSRSVGKVEVVTKPEGLFVTLVGDGVSLAKKTPALFEAVPTGDYQLRYEFATGSKHSARVTVASRETARVVEDFESGQLVISASVSNAQVSVNGVAKGTAPCRIGGLVPGKYTIVVQAEGFVTKMEEVALEAKEEKSFRADLAELPEKAFFRKLCAKKWIDSRGMGVAGWISFSPDGSVELTAHDSIMPDFKYHGNIQDLDLVNSRFRVVYKSGWGLKGHKFEFQLRSDDLLEMRYDDKPKTTLYRASDK